MSGMLAPMSAMLQQQELNSSSLSRDMSPLPSGLPQNWTCLEPGSVRDNLSKIYDWSNGVQEAGLHMNLRSLQSVVVALCFTSHSQRLKCPGEAVPCA